MIDLHNHILPGIDDGAKNWQESLAMARAAQQDGISAIVCTPHWVIGQYENTSSIILDAMAKLQRLCHRRQVEVKLFPGAELHLDPTIAAAIDTGELLTINRGRYALIELPVHIMPPNLDMFLYSLAGRNITPVLAHPERYFWLMEDPAVLFDWVQAGYLIQITAASLLGYFGHAIQRFTVQLLEHNLAHILATDTHGMKMRSPRLSQAREKASRIVGEEAAIRLVHHTPQAVLAGNRPEIAEPIAFTERGGWRGFFSFFSRKRYSRPRG